MKLTKTKPNWFLILILPFLMTSSEASLDDDDVRILIVGIRGDSRFSAADLLSGRKDGGQEDREIAKTPVITDEGRRMMLVTGPNLCEEDTARQSFTTALFLSSPGPHAVLMVLNLNDQESEQCDVVGRAQEMLGAEVLQHCIVLLHQNHQERFTGESSGIAGGMINACGGRFYTIRDSEPKPAQAAALVAEIDKLVWFNADGFYSVLKQVLKLQEMSQDVHEESQLLSALYDTLGGAAGIIGWIFLISLTALVVHTKGNDKILNLCAKSAALVLLMIYIRHFLSPDVAIPLNLALVSSLATVFTIDRRVIEDSNLSSKSSSSNITEITKYLIVNVLIHSIFVFAAVMSLPFLLGSALVFGTMISVRSWSDVLIACYAAPGVSIGAFVCNERIARESQVFALWSFLCCSLGATLSVGFVNTLFALLDVKMTIILLTLGFTMAYFYLRKETIEALQFLLIILGFPCGCVFMGSVFLILGLMMSFLKVLIQNLISSYLFYVALFLGALLAISKRNT